MKYTDGFKARMVQRMAGVEGISASALSKEVGTRQPTLSRWLREARTVRSMGGSNNNHNGGAKSSRQWSAAEKLQVVLEATALSDDELGEFLRRKGLHTAQLEEWHRLATEAAQTALAGPKKGRAKKSPEARRIKELEKELRRKEKALAEVAALLVLKKKVQEIWGDEDDDTPTRSGT